MCAHHNISILCYSTLQQGLLSGKINSASDMPEGRRRTRLFRSPEQGGAEKSRHGGPGVEEELFDAEKGGVLPQLKKTAEKEGLTLIDLATAWLLRRTAVVLVGASNPRQVTRNARLAKISDAVDERITTLGEDIKRKLGPEIDQYSKKSRVNGNEWSA